MYVLSDVSNAGGRRNIGRNVHSSHMYATADVCGRKGGPNLGSYVQCAQVYASVEVCGAETTPDLGACAHAVKACASAEVSARPPTVGGAGKASKQRDGEPRPRPYPQLFSVSYTRLSDTSAFYGTETHGRDLRVTVGPSHCHHEERSPVLSASDSAEASAESVANP